MRRRRRGVRCRRLRQEWRQTIPRTHRPLRRPRRPVPTEHRGRQPPSRPPRSALCPARTPAPEPPQSLRRGRPPQRVPCWTRSITSILSVVFQAAPFLRRFGSADGIEHGPDYGECVADYPLVTFDSQGTCWEERLRKPSMELEPALERVNIAGRPLLKGPSWQVDTTTTRPNECSHDTTV